MNPHNLTFLGHGKGWPHLSRMASHQIDGEPLPDETIAFFAELSRSLMDRKLELYEEDTPRRRTHNVLSSLAMKKLQITETDRGDGDNKRKSVEELRKTKAGQQAMRCAQIIYDDPDLNSEEVFSQVAAEFGGRDGLEKRTVELAWEQLWMIAVGTVNTGK